MSEATLAAALKVINTHCTTPPGIDGDQWADETAAAIVGELGLESSICVSGTATAVVTAPAKIPFSTFYTTSSAISYDSGTRRFTVAQAGKYLITMNPFFNSGSAARRIMIGKNTDTPTSASNWGMIYSNNTTVYDAGALISVLDLAANDYIVFYLSEGSLYSATNDAFNQFSIVKLEGAKGETGAPGADGTITADTVTGNFAVIGNLTVSGYPTVGAGIVESSATKQKFSNGFAINVSATQPTTGQNGDVWFQI